MAFSVYSKPSPFYFGPHAIVGSRSLISSVFYTCAEGSQFTRYCVTCRLLVPAGLKVLCGQPALSVQEILELDSSWAAR